MATYADCDTPLFFDDVQLSARQARLALSALVGSHDTSTELQVKSGVKITNSTSLKVEPSANMTIKINSGAAFIQGTDSLFGDTQGVYVAVLRDDATITLPNADGSNPRYDRICLVITETGSASSTARVTYVEGTPAGSPSIPAEPDSAITLAVIAVAASETEIEAGHITDYREQVVAHGGVLPVASSSDLGTPSTDGQLAYDLSREALMTSEGSNWFYVPNYHVCTSSTRPVAVYNGAHILETDTYNTMIRDGSQWRPERPYICTSSTRPTYPRNGTLIYEVDTYHLMQYSTAFTAWYSVSHYGVHGYTVTWGSSGTTPDIGNGALQGAYAELGPMCFVTIYMEWGSTTTGGTGNWNLSLPKNTGYAYSQGQALIVDTTGGELIVDGIATPNGSTCNIFAHTSSSQTTYVTATHPMTWATGDQLRISMMYPLR